MNDIKVKIVLFILSVAIIIAGYISITSEEPIGPFFPTITIVFLIWKGYYNYSYKKRIEEKLRQLESNKEI
ncbi:MAG TPA: hypothetical protein DCR23_06900 [Ruminococcaceae bacterium]|nr:hypothetical protein [Oscillospiraceae bacterium]